MSESQKLWLISAKKAVSKNHKNITWDAFADLAGIDRRAFKTYRMPAESANYRNMPTLVEAAINNLLLNSVKPLDFSQESLPQASNDLLLPALAALVMRQARVSLIEGQMVSGSTKTPNMPVGLLDQDRRAMALVSRSCLVNSLPDHGSEIHHLLHCCTQPLGMWLPVPEVKKLGLEHTRLIEYEDGIPSAETEDIAADFSDMTSRLEEQLFMRFMEVLGKFPRETANEYYTVIREFIVRHPVVKIETMKAAGADFPYQLWTLLQQQFYEPVPESWQIDGFVRLCSACGNAMQRGKAGLVCRSKVCSLSRSAAPGGGAPAASLFRATRGVRQYWVEPGIDEIQLFDALVGMHLPAKLYPNRDLVDISIGNIGMDLKAYASPETLGRKFSRSIGGLSEYAKRWVVVPDWLLINAPTYLDRLRRAAERNDLRFMSCSDVLKHFASGVEHA